MLQYNIYIYYLKLLSESVEHLQYKRVYSMLPCWTPASKAIPKITIYFISFLIINVTHRQTKGVLYLVDFRLLRILMTTHTQTSISH